MATFSDTITESVARRLMESGVVFLAGVNDGVAAIQAALDIGTAWNRPTSLPLVFSRFDHPGEAAVRVLDEHDSKCLLNDWGITVPPSSVAYTPLEAAAAAEAIGYPVVVKTLGVMHKTEVNGVRLNLGSSDEVKAAAEAMSGLSESYLVEKMVDGGVAEIIVGVARDEQFGPYLVIGSGGVLVEMIKDSASILLPTCREQILEALARLKCAPLLNGFRGAPPADLYSLVDAVMALASAIERDPSAIVELDINPLILLPEGRGVYAADALIKLSGEPKKITGSEVEMMGDT